jgi:hypothetical protein
MNRYQRLGRLAAAGLFAFVFVAQLTSPADRLT